MNHFRKQDTHLYSLPNSLNLSNTSNSVFFEDVTKKDAESPQTSKDSIDQPFNSQVWITLQRYFSSGIRVTELKSIAKFLQFYLNLPFISRKALRSCPLLIKWFEDNWSKIYPFLPYISLLDDNLQPINHFREMNLKDSIDL